MPDIVFASKDVVPEGLREFAEEKDGKIVVDVAPNKKLKEFRDNNIAANQARDAANAKVQSFVTLIGHDDAEKFKGEFAALQDVAQKVKDGTLKGTDAIQKAVSEAVDAKLIAKDQQLANVVKERDDEKVASAAWKSAFKKQVLRQEITNTVLEADSGAEASALPDIIARAEGAMVVLDDGRVEIRDGDKVVYSVKDGSSPMAPKEWLAKQLESAPHLRKISAGGGANGGRDGGKQYAGLSKEAWDKLSPQEQITRHRKANRQ